MIKMMMIDNRNKEMERFFRTLTCFCYALNLENSEYILSKSRHYHKRLCKLMIGNILQICKSHEKTKT